MHKVVILANFKHFGVNSFEKIVASDITPTLVTYSDEATLHEMRRIYNHDIYFDIRSCTSSDVFERYLMKRSIPIHFPTASLYVSLRECRALFYPMMRRMYHKQHEITELESYFHACVRFAFSFLVGSEAKTVLFHNTPHEGWNFVFYHVAKYLNVRCLMPERILIDKKFFFLEDMKSMPIPPGEIYLDSSYSEYNVDHTFLTYIAGRQLTAFESNHLNLKYLINKFIRYMSLARLIFAKCDDPLFALEEKKPSLLRYYVYRAAAKNKINGLRAFYNKKSKALLPESKYLYFPLQLQPERTTIPMGGDYWDQLEIIRMLSKAVPDDWLIVIKEHPRQFTRDPMYFSTMRSIEFYKSLVSMNNVVIADLQLPSQKIIEGSCCVATVTGTAGWEALMFDKPVCVFGFPWYRNVPSIHRYESFDRLIDFFRSIGANKYSYDKVKNTQYIKWLVEEYCVNGYLNPMHLKSSDDFAKNSDVLGDLFVSNIIGCANKNMNG